MSDAFEEREKGYEAKFKMDQELKFKAEARRNKLLGQWLAMAFGMTDSQTEAYAKEVVVADLDEPGIGDVVRKVMADIEKHGANISEDQVRGKIEELDGVAMRQLMAEFPEAIEKDHDHMG